MTIEPVELQEFVSSTIKAIEDGVDLETRDMNLPIEITVNIENVTKTEGGVKAYVLNASADKTATNTATIKFYVQTRQSEKNKRAIGAVVQMNEENNRRYSEII